MDLCNILCDCQDCLSFRSWKNNVKQLIDENELYVHISKLILSPFADSLAKDAFSHLLEWAHCSS